MKKSLNLLLGGALAIAFFACDPPKDAVTPAPDDRPGSQVGAVTPIGTTNGTAVTAQIGPAGGSIESADKRILVRIPAGALATEQTISVQQLTNQCPAGTGIAFRLLPHGITFAKPASITFQYNDEDLNGTAPELLRIAYQNDKAVWQSPALKSLDTTAHSLTIQTSHFSDWGLFQSMVIYPGNSILDPGGSVELKGLQVLSDFLPGDDAFIPLPSVIITKLVN